MAWTNRARLLPSGVSLRLSSLADQGAVTVRSQFLIFHEQIAIHAICALPLLVQGMRRYPINGCGRYSRSRSKRKYSRTPRD